MPTARAKYDGNKTWKYRLYDKTEWNELTVRVQEKLRPLYPDQNATAAPPFEHPADTWATELLNVAHDAISDMQSRWRRLTNEQLRKEQADVLKRLKKADECLSNLSDDLANIVGRNVDVVGCSEEIRKLIPGIEAASAKIAKLAKAKRKQDVENVAAIYMAVRILPMLMRDGITASATVNESYGRISNAIKILKFIGDALGIKLGEETWKKVILEAKPLIVQPLPRIKK